jgi:hypothetical protein
MSAEALFRELAIDLESLRDRFADEEFSAELYRALARSTLTKPGHEGHVALSFTRAEEVVNLTRRIFGREPLELAQSGGEGEVSETVRGELQRLGWRIGSLDTSEHDDAHVEHEHVAVPKDRTGRGGREWERQAHEEADREQLRRRLG